MKSLRVLFALAVVALCAGTVAANCGSCEKKDNCTPADHAACAEKDAKAGGKDCAQCEKKEHCTEADKAQCDKDKAKHACCEEAAKAGKPCEKCQPAAEKK